MYCQVYRHYWSQRGFPIPGNVQKEDCDLLRFTPTVRFVADMHAISSLAGDDGANSIFSKSQVFFFFYLCMRGGGTFIMVCFGFAGRGYNAFTILESLGNFAEERSCASS